MSEGSGELFLRLLGLARKQKAAVEAGNLEEASALADQRRLILVEIQRCCDPGGSGKPEAPEVVVREILSSDETAGGIIGKRMKDISKELDKINTFKVLCQGAVDGARARSVTPNP